MIVLDTNVVSELLRPRPAPAVLRWVDARPPASLFTTVITQAEILYGIELLPRGRRREALRAAAEAVLREDFADRILPADSAAARAFAGIAADRRAQGRPISHADAWIAAIAASREATVATRNTADFEGCGVDLVDPWAEVRPTP